MSSHFFHIWALICCLCLTLGGKQPGFFTWEHTEAGSLRAVDRKILLSWCFGIYQASAPSSIIHSLSRAPLHPCVCVRVCHVSLYHSVCSHDMLSLDFWKATFPQLLSQNLLFPEHGLVFVVFPRAETSCFFHGLYTNLTADLLWALKVVWVTLFYWPDPQAAFAS